MLAPSDPLGLTGLLLECARRARAPGCERGLRFQVLWCWKVAGPGMTCSSGDTSPISWLCNGCCCTGTPPGGPQLSLMGVQVPQICVQFPLGSAGPGTPQPLVRGPHVPTQRSWPQPLSPCFHRRGTWLSINLKLRFLPLWLVVAAPWRWRESLWEEVSCKVPNERKDKPALPSAPSHSVWGQQLLTEGR